MKRICLVLYFLFIGYSGYSQTLKVAIAANLQSVMKVLTANFNKKSGISVETISGASGNLATQIRNGAPFDMFLSADMANPEALFRSGFALEKPRIYALGSLIVCSTSIKDLKNWKALILTNEVQKIALANPEIAPYGKAAKESLEKFQIMDKIKDKLVTGESVSQVNTYITTGVASLGFTTRSFVVDAPPNVNVYWKEVETDSYSPIRQGLVLLKHAQGNTLIMANKFYQYIFGSQARKIWKQYGYKEATSYFFIAPN